MLLIDFGNGTLKQLGAHRTEVYVGKLRYTIAVERCRKVVKLNGHFVYGESVGAYHRACKEHIQLP